MMMLTSLSWLVLTWYVCTAVGQDTELIPGSNYTGTLLFKDSEGVTLAIVDVQNSTLHDNSDHTGVELPTSTQIIMLNITLSTNWSIGEIVVEYTDTDEKATATDNTLIEYFDSFTNTDGAQLWLKDNDLKAEFVDNVGIDHYFVKYEYPDISTTEIFTNQFIFNIDLATTSGESVIAIDIQGSIPTFAPTNIPTMEPTTSAPTPPSPSPTIQPTIEPSISPTFSPTNVPTIEGYYSLTPRDLFGSQSNFTWSDNVYPLAYRNKTYGTYTVPGNEPFCATCILAWADIDANITVAGCEDSYDFGIVDSDNVILQTGDFYYCNGTWIIETSASLVSFQQTYGRLEIWEVDDYGRKYLQEFFEFQWNTSTCEWGGNGEPCDVLPLTGDPTNAAMFKWSMPKNMGDNRDSPLIIVWYDLLGVPYSLRPVVGEEWWNLTFSRIKKVEELGVKTVLIKYAPYLFIVGTSMTAIVIMMIFSCILTERTVFKQDYMLDTRDIRTTYIHSVSTLIAPQSDIISRSKFSWKRHGLWLTIVLIFRIAYMILFTLTAFQYILKDMNRDSFNVLKKYSKFEYERDSQLLNMSSAIEAYYYNETDRMEEEVTNRELYCYTHYKNETNSVYNHGLVDQYNNHSAQMQNSLTLINFDNITSGLYISGATACTIDENLGAEILSQDPYSVAILDEDGGKNGAGEYSLKYYYAQNYSRSILTGNYNFTFLEELLTSVCEDSSDCVGWTWIDSYIDNITNISYPNSYYFLSVLGDPINNKLNGLCYTTSEFDSSLYQFSSVNDLINYTDYLEDLYLENYISDVDDIFNTLNNLWDAVLSNFATYDNDDGEHTFETVINRDATEFNIELLLVKWDYGSGSDRNTTFYTDWQFVVDCPNCPEGNFTNAYLQELSNYFYSLNASNISDYVTGLASTTNFSDYISINNALLEYPDIPEIELFVIDLPKLNFMTFINILLHTIDAILFIYRWYKTAGIVATIIRGQDVEINIEYLKTNIETKPICCNFNNGQKCCDIFLNCIIWCYDKLKHCGYNFVKVSYWLWRLLILLIIVFTILILYIAVDEILTVEFFESLGTFDLLTVGIAAQRSIRNEVICTTAASYNEYTLSLLESSRASYADEKNEQAWDQNVDELDRVDEYNSYYCDAYASYQANPRDITRDCGCTLQSYTSTNLTIYKDKIGLMFDSDSTTFWGVSINDSLSSDINIFIDIKLPSIQMTSDTICYWKISQIVFDWRFHSNGTQADSLSTAEFEIYAKENVTNNYRLQEVESNVYQVPSIDTDNDIDTINVGWDITVEYIRILLRNINEWEDTLYLNEISFIGSADEDCILCDKVEFYYWDFNAYDTYVEMCPYVTPIHGIMYRGWVRNWLTKQLIIGHTPFIKAIRNIGLSPFFILFFTTIALVIIHILSFVIVWILIKLNLYRENPYTKVPLVHAKDSEFYDVEMHDIDNNDIRKNNTIYFGNSKRNIMENDDIRDENEDEYGDGSAGLVSKTIGDSSISSKDVFDSKNIGIELGNLVNLRKNGNDNDNRKEQRAGIVETTRIELIKPIEDISTKDTSKSMDIVVAYNENDDIDGSHM